VLEIQLLLKKGKAVMLMYQERPFSKGKNRINLTPQKSKKEPFGL